MFSTEELYSHVTDLKAALELILDQVDYVHGNCRPNEMVGAVLSKELIELARTSLKGLQDV